MGERNAGKKIHVLYAYKSRFLGIGDVGHIDRTRLLPFGSCIAGRATVRGPCRRGGGSGRGSTAAPTPRRSAVGARRQELRGGLHTGQSSLCVWPALKSCLKMGPLCLGQKSSWVHPPTSQNSNVERSLVSQRKTFYDRDATLIHVTKSSTTGMSKGRLRKWPKNKLGHLWAELDFCPRQSDAMPELLFWRYPNTQA